MTRRRLGALLALIALAVLATPCAQSAAEPPARPGLVDIGHGRRLFLQCQGAGSPTVFVIPGKGSYAEAWNYVVPDDDPIRSSPYDVIGQAELVPSPHAVQPTVARTTQICVYDRPDTRPDGPDRSTPVPQPHTLQQDVDDVVALINAAQLPTPLVFVAHSYGGLVLDLLARTHPQLLAGIVMADGVSEYLPTVGSPAQNAAWERDVATPAEPGGEGIVLNSEVFEQIRDAPALPTLPAIVLSAGKFASPEQLTSDNYTLAQIHRANTMLAEALGTVNTVAIGSGHNMMLYQPKLLADNVMAVIEQVRQPS